MSPRNIYRCDWALLVWTTEDHPEHPSIVAESFAQTAVAINLYSKLSTLSSLRSWNNVYCVLKPGQLSAYKDAKSFSHSVTYHGEEPLTLTNASCEILTNYKKKKQVFKLRYGSWLSIFIS